MPEIALVLIQRAEQFITLQMTTLTAFQHAAHALLQLIAAANNTGHQRQLLLRQRRGGEVREGIFQGLLGLQQAFSFAFILQRADHLGEANRRGGNVRGVARQIHTAGHIIQRLPLHLFL